MSTQPVVGPEVKSRTMERALFIAKKKPPVNLKALSRFASLKLFLTTLLMTRLLITKLVSEPRRLQSASIRRRLLVIKSVNQEESILWGQLNQYDKLNVRDKFVARKSFRHTDPISIINRTWRTFLYF